MHLFREETDEQEEDASTCEKGGGGGAEAAHCEVLVEQIEAYVDNSSRARLFIAKRGSIIGCSSIALCDWTSNEL